MVTSIHTCALVGCSIYPVNCEVDLSNSIPSFQLVGLPSSMTQESRERVRAAITNAGFDIPPKRITINMLPAHLPKWGSHFELPMALGILQSMQNQGAAEHTLFSMGELSLDGSIREVGWAALLAEWLMQGHFSAKNITLVAHPNDVTSMQKYCPEIENHCHLIAIKHLNEFPQLSESLEKNNTTPLEHGAPQKIIPENALPLSNFTKLKSIENEPLAKLAGYLAIAGRLHALFAGSHGVGKTHMVQGICEATPPLSFAKAIQRKAYIDLMTLGTQSAASPLNHDSYRPIVALQTSISRAALEGALLNNGQVNMGELSKAHLGTLVMDEFAEFRRDVLEALRQPIEEKLVRLQRAKLKTTMPCDFQLLASTNLCGCGRFSPTKPYDCRCSKLRIETVQTKLSGPILDRFDLVLLMGVDRHHFLSRRARDELDRLLATPHLGEAAVSLREAFLRERVSMQVQMFKDRERASRSRVKKLVIMHAFQTLFDIDECTAAHEEILSFLREDITRVFTGQGFMPTARIKPVDHLQSSASSSSVADH